MKLKTYQSNQIELEEAEYLYIQASQIADSGNGLYTAIDIYREEIICLFSGEIIGSKEAKTRADNLENQYFVSLLNGKIMDSKNSFCYAKYANDASGVSPSIFRNNAKITLNEKQEVCLVATRKIKAGEEIYCSYGKRYWKR